MSISKQIESMINTMTDNNIPVKLVTIIRGYKTEICDINSDNGVIKNIQCSSIASAGDKGLLVYLNGDENKPFVLLFTDLSNYYTKEEIDEIISGGASLKDYVKKEELNGILSSYVTVNYGNTNYALKTELFSKDYNELRNKPTIPSKTSQLTNDSGFLTQHQSLTNYYNKSETNNLLNEIDADKLDKGEAVTSITLVPKGSDPTTDAYNGIIRLYYGDEP